MGDFGRRWSAHQSDIDSDYRRELATSGGNGVLHQEARGRDGGGSSILVNCLFLLLLSQQNIADNLQMANKLNFISSYKHSNNYFS